MFIYGQECARIYFRCVRSMTVAKCANKQRKTSQPKFRANCCFAVFIAPEALINLCTEFSPKVIFLCRYGSMRGQDFSAAWSIQRKYFLAPFKSICTLPTETLPSLHRKYFWTYRENILSRLEQFLCNATNQVWQIRLCWLQPPWHIYCAPKFETLVNLSFHSYTFCHASLQKQKDSETYSQLPTTQMIANDLFVKCLWYDW